MTDENCTFTADSIVPTSGGGYRRIKNVRCIGEPNHRDEHHFIAGGELIYGVTHEKGHWVARR